MKIRLIALTTTAALALGACGGGDGGPQSEVADMFIDAMAEQDVKVDEGCVKDAMKQLSDEDAQKILDAGVDGSPDVSDDAAAAGAEALGCVDSGALVDQMITDLVDEVGADNVDEQCLREALQDFDIAELESGTESLMRAAFDCMSTGG